MTNEPPAATGTRKFLIVDDHAAFRQTLRAFLPAGVVTECADGRDVIARYAAERPDWVLMDIEMPGVDGLTATRQLKQRFPEAQVIIVSHHGEEEFRSAARDLGTLGFVHKEHLEELRQIIADSERTRRNS
jgi:two-component system response regulator DegU